MTSQQFVYLERLSALRVSLTRQAAARLGIQGIHAEILEYLSHCNKYSNTAQALSEYLGVTKGSISQSLKTLEEKGLITRIECKEDKRYFRLSLSQEGKKIVKNMKLDLPETTASYLKEESLEHILKTWQNKNNLRSFGLCETCKHKETIADNKFRCGLTKEKLSVADTKKICREHAYQD